MDRLSNTARTPATQAAGFTLLEVTVGIVVLVIGLVALAGLIVSVSRQRELAAAERLVLSDGISLLERIKGTVPETVPLAYNATTYNVTGIKGAQVDGTVLSVNVDSTNPKLLIVTIDAKWTVVGVTYTLQLQTEIYSPLG